MGFYSSPHLVETTERFRIDGRDMTPQEFCEALDAVDAVTKDLPLTHFETPTSMAACFYHLGEALPQPDWVLYEVGLGGL